VGVLCACGVAGAAVEEGGGLGVCVGAGEGAAADFVSCLIGGASAGVAGGVGREVPAETAAGDGRAAPAVACCAAFVFASCSCLCLTSSVSSSICFWKYCNWF
jgi:hypothetical protein